jgi:hypothetical protein
VRKTAFLGGRRFILDVKPFPLPALDGVGELHVKIVDIGTDADANATYVVDDVLRVVAPEEEDAFPEGPVRVDAQETFTEYDKLALYPRVAACLKIEKLISKIFLNIDVSIY